MCNRRLLITKARQIQNFVNVNVRLYCNRRYQSYTQYNFKVLNKDVVYIFVLFAARFPANLMRVYFGETSATDNSNRKSSSFAHPRGKDANLSMTPGILGGIDGKFESVAKLTAFVIVTIFFKMFWGVEGDKKYKKKHFLLCGIFLVCWLND